MNDFRDYFNTKIAQERARTEDLGIATKYQEVQQASKEKIQVLKAFSEERAIREASLAKSVVGQLGLDPDSVVGSIVNTGVASVAAPFTVAGEALATLVENVPGSKEFEKKLRARAELMRQKSNMDEYVAINEDTGERTSSIQRRAGDVALSLGKGTVALGDAIIGIPSLAGGYVGKGWEELGRDSKATNQFLDSLRSPEQQLASKKLEDATGFLNTIEAGLDNPSTIAHGILESLPAMLGGGAIGKELLGQFPKLAAMIAKSPMLTAALAKAPSLTTGVAGAIGEGAMMAGSASEGIRTETEDGLLSFKQSLLAAGTGVMGAAVGFGGNKLAGKLGLGDIDEAVVAGALAKSPRGMLTNVVGSGAIEGAEELLQSGGESILKNVALDHPWDDDVADSMAIGLMTGTPMGMYSGLGKSIKEKAVESEKQATKIAATEAAIQSGDVTTLIDPKSPTFAPENAISALAGNSVLETTTPEAKEANFEKATQIVADLIAEKEVLEERIRLASPEGIESIRAEVVGLREQMATATPEMQEKLAMFAEMQEERIAAELEKPTDVKSIQLQIEKLDAVISKSNTALTVFSQNREVMNTDVAAELEVINAPVDTANPEAVVQSQKSVEKIINLSMAAPERLDVAVATQLANNPANGLTEPQRAYLRAFGEARISSNELKNIEGVSQEILVGSKKNLGIVDYRNQVAAALQGSNQKLADNRLGLLSNFVDSHTAKAKMVAEQFEEFKTTNKPVQIIRDDAKKQWVVNTGTWLNEKQRVANGGVNINDKSIKLVANIGKEAAALQDVQKELKAAYAVKFNSSQGTTNNVADLSQQQAVQSVQQSTEAAEVQPTAVPIASTSIGTDQAGSTSITPVEPTTTEAGSGVELSGFSAALNVDNVYNSWSNVRDGSDRQSMVDQMESVAKTYAPLIAQGKTKEVVAELNNFKWFKVATPEQKQAAITALVTPKTSTPTIETTANPSAFSNMVRMQYGEPISLVAKNNAGEEIGRLTYMPNGGPIDVFVKESERRKGVGSLLYDAFEQAGGKLPTLESGVIVSDEARALREKRSKNAVITQEAPASSANTVGTQSTQVTQPTTVDQGQLQSNEQLNTTPSATEIVGSTEALPVTQVQYAEAQRVMASNNESDYDNVPADIARVITAIQNDEPINVQSNVSTTSVVAPATKVSVATDSEYLTNRPGNYKTQDAQDIVDRSRNQLVQVNNELATADDPNVISELEDLQAQLRQNIKQGETIVAADKEFKPATELPSETTPEGIVEDEDGEFDLSIDEIDQEQTEVADIESVQPGTLKAVVEKSEGEAEYTAKKFGDFFVQVLGRDTDGSIRPLVAVKDFLSQLASSAVKVQDYLKDKTALSSKQSELLSLFKAKAKEWSPLIAKDLVPSHNPYFNYEDPIRYLIEQVEGTRRGDVEENVKTAMTAAIFMFVADQMSKAYNDKNSINSILGNKPDDYTPPEAYTILGKVGSLQHTVADSVGQKVLDGLGIKAMKSTPQNLIVQLRTSLGLHALHLMEQQGIVTRHEVTDAAFKSLKPSSEVVLPDGKDLGSNLQFFALARNDDMTLVPKVEAIASAMKETKSLLSNLFSIQGGVKNPSLEPIKQVQKKTDTGMNVPSVLSKVLNQKQTKEGWSLKQDMHWLVSSQLSEEVRDEIFGIEEVTEENTHIVNQTSKQSKMDGLRREYQLFTEFVSEYLSENGNIFDQKFYLEYDVWKQQRVGINVTSANPQSSKIHRYLIGLPDWAITYKMDNETQMRDFKLRVAEGLGVKTERKDNDQWDSYFDSLMAQEVFVTATKALQRAITASDKNTELSEEDQTAIREAIKEGGQKMHTLDTLIGWAKYQAALEAGEGSFVSEMVGEVDGVANGTMLNHIMLGAANNVDDLATILEMGGFFTTASQYRQYGEYRSAPGNKDIYETNALKINNTIAQAIEQKQFSGTVVNALWATGGKAVDEGEVTKAGRDLVKNATNPLSFGSGLKKIVTGMADTYIETLYEGFEKMSVKDADQETIDQYVGHINTILKSQGVAGLPVGFSINRYMKMSYNKVPGFNREQLKALRNAHSSTIGAATEAVIKENFAPFIQRKNAETKAANLAFNLYIAVYEVMRKEAIGTMSVPVDSKGVPIADLSAAQEAELQKKLTSILPVMHSVMSKQSNTLSAGLLMATKDKGTSEDRTYRVETKFNSKNGKGSSQAIARGQTTKQAQPGVVMLSAGTHSSDSAMSHYAMDGHQALNNHDAQVVGAGNVASAGQRLNQNVWSVSLNYSPLQEAYTALARVITNINEMNKRGELSPEALQNIARVLNKEAREDSSGEMDLLTTLHATKQEALASDRVRLGFMSKLASIDQYAIKGGAYTVKDSDRAAAAKMLDKLETEVPAADNQALNELANAVFGTPMPKVDVGFWGPLGESLTASNPNLVTFFDKHKEASTNRVITELKSLLSKAKQEPHIEFQTKLLNQLARVLPKDVKIQYVTPKTDPKAAPNGVPEKSRGWYNPATNTIFVLSPEFKHSGLKVELLLHEMTHAALVHAMENPSPANQPFVAELETLLEEARAYAKSIQQDGLYKNALKDVHEFVAYGLTNKSFRTEILEKIKYPSTTLGSLTTAAKRFFNAVSRILFGKVATQTEANGMEVLVANVSSIFAEMHHPNQEIGDRGNLSMASPDPQEFTTVEILQALNSGSTTPSFQEHLTSLMGGVVEKLHGPFGAFAQALRANAPTSPLDAWVKAKQLGVAPFASKVMSNMATTEQEAFAIEQVEATVRAALNDNESLTKSAYKELMKLFLEAKNKLTAADFASQAEYDFIFNNVEFNADGKSDYLARFAALGLAHERVNKTLQFTTTKDARSLSGASITDKLEIIFDRILAFFSDKITKTYQGQQANFKLNTLVGQLVDIEAKHRTLLKQRAEQSPFLQPVEDKVQTAVESIRKTVVDVAGSNFVRTNSNAFVRATGGALRVVANNQVDQFLLGVSKMHDKHFNDGNTFAKSLLTEFTGHVEQFKALLRNTKNNERIRKAFITNRSQMVLKAFTNEGKNLSKAAKAGLSQTVLRTGMHNLVDVFTTVEIENMLADSAVLEQNIATVQAKLTGPMKNHYTGQANVLGHYKATGKVRGLLMMNAHLIARLSGTQYAKRITEADAKKAEENITVLTTLFALKYTPAKNKAAALEVFRDENTRTDNNGHGVEFMLTLHKRMEQESLDRLFKGNPALMVHGYTPEIYNPHTDIQVVNEVEGKNLLDQSYEEYSETYDDVLDPQHEARKIYVLKGGGLAPYLSGAMSLKSLGTKGTTKHSGYMNPHTAGGMANATLQAEITNRKLSQFNVAANPNRDLSQVEGNNLAPVYNENGDVVNWRYLMNEQVKDDLLERDNTFENLLGTLAGSIYDKQTSTEQNKDVIAALREDFKTHQAKDPNAFVEVGPMSSNPEHREIWAMLPEATRQDIRRVWGRDGMTVRSESLDLIFGYRKYSLANPFKKGELERLEANYAEKMLVTSVEWAMMMYARTYLGMNQAEADRYTKRAAVYAARGEGVWQEIVREMKDIIVVKSGTVMLWNNYSNASLLVLKGVPLLDIPKGISTALKAATSYQIDTKELDRLETLLASGYTQGKDDEINQTIARLKDAIQRNPAKELIDAGLMPTIVEDVAAEDNIYSYKTMFAEKVEKYTDKVHPGIRSAARTVYMTHDTNAYKALNRITQLSDFAARYVLYSHLTTRKNNPLSKEKAIQEASDFFVNYDIPMHRGLQYTDDMGITMFTKYFLRIQKPLLQLGRENPGRVLTAVLLNQYMSLGPIVLDSSFISHIGNDPIRGGALNYFGSLDNLGTVNGAMTLLK